MTNCFVTSTLATSLVAAVPAWTTPQSGINARLRGVSAVNERVAWASGSDKNHRANS
jgi:hypothetical protein